MVRAYGNLVSSAQSTLAAETRSLHEGTNGRGSALFPFLVDSLYLGGLLVTVPYLVCAGRGRQLADHLRRQSRQVPTRQSDKPCVWVHGVSVGEILSARHFLQQFAAAYADWDIVLSTTTKAGIEAGEIHFPERSVVTYPFDLSFLVRRAFERIRPDLVLIVEHELWPNFLRCAASRGVPVAIVNGRLSERSLRGYRWLSRVMAWPPKNVLRVCVEDDTSADGFEELGVPRERIVVTGNFKFDNHIEAVDGTRSSLKLTSEDWVVVAASTHPGEEEIVLDAYRKLLAGDQRCRLFVVPRRIERSAEISRMIEKRGLRPLLWSQLGNVNGHHAPAAERSRVAVGGPDRALTSSRNPAGRIGQNEVVVVDSIGELQRVATCADVVFVGGSLVPFGGHNVIEPASVGRPVVVGPHTHNFRQVIAKFQARDALVVVRDADELHKRLEELKQQRGLAEAIGQRGAETVAQNVGASERTLDALRPIVDELSKPQGRSP